VKNGRRLGIVAIGNLEFGADSRDRSGQEDNLFQPGVAAMALLGDLGGQDPVFRNAQYFK
jgi:hypothetical protein